jgi:radical SAM superfamily enzyme YgiQ (UPF0313 family)
VLDYTVDEILHEVSTYKPDVLGVSFLTPQEDGAYKLIEKLKSNFKDLPIIVGGTHPTCFPKETMEKCKDIDILVTGEGEYLMLDIIRCMQGEKSFREVKGIYYRNDKREIMETPRNGQAVDLETLPLPARHLYSLASYAPEPFENKKLPSTNIIVSRGCAYAKCTFCYRSGILKRKYRIQSVEKTLDEIRYLIKKFSIKEFIFYDDDLGSNKEWLIKFCNLLKKERIPIIWSFRARPNAIDDEILKQAKEAGCFSVSFGFESGNQDLLDNIRKGITLEQSKKAADWANSLDLEIVGTFMLGLPGETPQKAEQTIKFAIELDCTYAAFIPTHPFYGTPLYEQCLKEGKIVLPTYSKNMCQTRYIPSVTYIPTGYGSKEEVEDMIKKAYRKFYLRPGYFLKHIRKVKRFEDIKRYWSGFNFLLGLS